MDNRNGSERERESGNRLHLRPHQNLKNPSSNWSYANGRPSPKFPPSLVFFYVTIEYLTKEEEGGETKLVSWALRSWPAIERTSGVDLVATGSPSTGGGRGRAQEPCSPKDLASAYDAAGLPVLC